MLPQVCVGHERASAPQPLAPEAPASDATGAAGQTCYYHFHPRELNSFPEKRDSRILAPPSERQPDFTGVMNRSDQTDVESLPGDSVA